MFIILGISTLISAIAITIYFFQVKDNKEMYVLESDNYPMYHWKFLRRYWIGILISILFFLYTMGLSMILITFT